MLARYGEQVYEKGRLMVKSSGSVLMRQAKFDESVSTCINGRVTATVVVTDHDSMVVLGDLHELYVLSKAKVKQNYEDSVNEITGSEPVDELHRSQGFKVYTRRRKPKFFYEIKAEDHLFRSFRTAFGRVQSDEVAHYLVIPDYTDCEGHVTPEIYMMSHDQIFNFTEIEKDPRKHEFKNVLAKCRKACKAPDKKSPGKWWTPWAKCWRRFTS